MSRLNPTYQTKRKLYLLSGNLCAFPNCSQRLVDDSGHFIGEICHIEGANEGGERYNPYQTDEERRDISNLILLCPNHHKITNNEQTYTVNDLREMKRNHESKSLYRNNENDVPSDYLYQEIIYPKNLFKIIENDEYYQDYFDDILKFIGCFEMVSIKAREYYAHCIINSQIDDFSLSFDPRIVNRIIGVNDNLAIQLYKELELKNLFHEWDSESCPLSVIGGFSCGNNNYSDADIIGYFLQEIKKLNPKTILDIFTNLNFSHLELQ